MALPVSLHYAAMPPVYAAPRRTSHFFAFLTLSAVFLGCSDNASVPQAGAGGSGGSGIAMAGGGSTASPGGAPTQGGASAQAGSNASAGVSALAGSGGAVAAAGAAGTPSGGTAGAGGSRGTALPPTCQVAKLWAGTATRPQLTDEAAACFTIKNALAASGPIAQPVVDNWDPSAGLPAASTFAAKFTVAEDDSGTHKTVQAALDAAQAAGGTERAYILVKPGSYHAPVCVKGAVPITLYGADADATKVTIAFDNYNGKTVPTGDATKVNACKVPSNATFGTSDSSTVWVSANDFQAMNLTIANDFAEPDGGTFQAVALSTSGDKAVFQNVRLLGNQDTLQPSSSSSAVVARSYYKSSYIEGDTDFIFGRGVAVFDDCDITYVGTRKKDGAHFAPSTDGGAAYGFLVINSRIAAGANAAAGAAVLGRAWDVSSEPNSNGEVVILNSKIDNHVNVAAPWKASTSGRAFDAATNRLYEYKNTGTGAAP